MATTASIWTPVELGKKDGDVLYSEAHSDGYVSGVGIGVLSSSGQIENISKLNAIFAGSPWLYLPSSDAYQAKEEDFLLEGYEDYLDPDDEEQQALLESAKETLAFAISGQLEEAFETKFAKVSLADKLEKYDLGLNAVVMNQDDHWKQFVGYSKVINASDAADFVVNKLISDNRNLHADYEYVWHDDQFWIHLEKTEYGDVIIPLIAAVILTDGNNTYGDYEYLNKLTDKDQEFMDKLLEKLADKDLYDHTKFFPMNAKAQEVMRQVMSQSPRLKI